MRIKFNAVNFIILKDMIASAFFNLYGFLMFRYKPSPRYENL